MRARLVGHVLGILLVCALVVSAGCAARARTQDTALALSEASLSIDAAERDAYQAGLYPAAQHQVYGAAISRLLHASRAFLVTAGSTDTATTLPARQELIAALDDLARVVQGVPPLEATVRTARVLLGD